MKLNKTLSNMPIFTLGFLAGVMFLVACGEEKAKNAVAHAGEEIWELIGTAVYYNDGNVGIGTNSPDYPLHVKGSEDQPDGVIMVEPYEADGISRDPKLIFRDPTGLQLMTIEQHTEGTGIAAHLQITNHQRGIIQFKTNNVEAMRISADGLVGIGNPTPNSALHVDGFIQLDTNSGSPPAAGDCTDEDERGRMIVDDVNDLLYICMASGWVAK